MVTENPVIGNRLAEVLEKKGLTAYRLAKMLGRYQHVIGRVVTGKRNASDALKLEIADALGMKVSEIFFFRDAEK